MKNKSVVLICMRVEAGYVVVKVTAGRVVVAVSISCEVKVAFLVCVAV